MYRVKLKKKTKKYRKMKLKTQTVSIKYDTRTPFEGMIFYSHCKSV